MPNTSPENAPSQAALDELPALEAATATAGEEAELAVLEAELKELEAEGAALAARMDPKVQRYAVLYRKLHPEAAAGEERDPDAPPMTAADAVVYLNHLVVTFLREQAEGFRIVEVDGATERDRKDARTVVGVCEDLISAAVAANEEIMRRKDRKVLVVADDATMAKAVQTILRGRKS